MIFSARIIKSFKSLSFVILGMLILQSNVFAETAQIKWQSYSQKIFTEAKRQDRLILVFVKADWCPHCVKMQATTLKDSSVIRLVNDSFIPVMIDVDQQRDLAIKYKVTGLPAFLVVDDKNKIIKTFSGEVSIIDFMNNLSQSYRDFRESKA